MHEQRAAVDFDPWRFLRVALRVLLPQTVEDIVDTELLGGPATLCHSDTSSLLVIYSHPNISQ